MDGRGPYKIETRIEKRTPGAAEPHTVEETVTYYEGDGTEVADHERKREIEVYLTTKHKEQN
jgi:hypothetical protein